MEKITSQPKNSFKIRREDQLIFNSKRETHKNKPDLLKNIYHSRFKFESRTNLTLAFAISMIIFAAIFLFASLPLSAWVTSVKDTHKNLETVRVEEKPISQQVDIWLRQLPAENKDEAQKIFSAMINVGSPVIKELCWRLVPAGQADDSLVRYALDGLINLSNQNTYKKYRRQLAADILENCRHLQSDEVKAFLLQEIELIITDSNLNQLRPFLRNSALTEITVRAMLRGSSQEAENILVKELDHLPGNSIQPVIQALGLIKSKKAGPKLRRFAESPDPEIKNLALTALVEIPDLTIEPLLTSRPTLSSKEEKSQAIALYLRYARRLAEVGQLERAQRIAEKALSVLTEKDEVSYRIEALNILVTISKEKSVPEIIKALWSDEPSFRQEALSLAKRYKWPELIDQLTKSLPGLPIKNRAEVIELLGQVVEQNQLEQIQKVLKAAEDLLNDQDESIRLAGLRAFFILEKEKAVPQLLSRLNNSEAEATLILELLKTLKPEVYKDSLIENFSQFSETTKTTVLEEMQGFMGPDWKGLVLPAIESENPQLKKAAVDCLALVVGPSDLDWLVNKLTAVEDPALISGYQKAVVAACGQIQDKIERQQKILSLLVKKNGKEKAAGLKMLYQIGGQECLKTVVQALNDHSAEISGAALASLTNWPEFEAVPYLVDLIKSNSDRKVRYLAFQGLARLMKAPGVSKEEKLRTLEEVKPLVTYPDEKNFMLMAWASIRDVMALKEISEFFSDENLRDRAVSLACRLARPVAGEKGLSGFETIMILKKALPFLKEDLEIQETEDYLDRLLRQEGFEPLFNRKDLFGWKGLVGDPVQRAKMTPKELAAQQKKADEDMRQHWRVVDGVLVFDGQGHSLCTVKDYCDFEMFVDWKIEPGGDSGIYLRGSPQVQIWDPAQWPEGSGGLYNNQKNPNKPLKRADNPVGTWNTFYLKMVGERVTVYLNGELVVDNVVMENYWERDKPIYRCGQIELQAHNTPLYFKNIYIREIK
ncbi:MAG: hypothetical protein C0168_03450 [Candidatus Aminicenantes bacterium]|nr:MAG: hypothetical protein C0168_03450 [Candidatus Aminicenantes bacterium]